MSFDFDFDRVVFEGDNFIVYDAVDLLPRHANYPHGTDALKPDGSRAIPASWRYRKRTKALTKAFIHQAAGGYARGWQGLMNVAHFFVRDPVYSNGRWIGNGRGWPGFAYTLWVSASAERHEDKVIVFLCRPLDEVSWHTGGHNDEAIGVGFQGLMRSRHIANFRPSPHDPTGEGRLTDDQAAVLEPLWDEYIRGKLGIAQDKVFGHFEASHPKPTCPGDELETWVLSERGETPDDPRVYFPPVINSLFVKLYDWKQRQAALVLLGCDLGDYGPKRNGVDGDPGYKTRAAIEVMEEELKLPVNGVWDDHLEFMVQLLLFARGLMQRDVDALT